MLSDDGWTLHTLNAGHALSDVLGRKGKMADGSDWVFGGSPHLRGVEKVRWAGNTGQFVLSSLDVPIVCAGLMTPFPTPRLHAPSINQQGVHFNIFNNIWNTNY